MNFDCPYNIEVECEDAACFKCGWYPPVAEARHKATEAILQALKEEKQKRLKLDNDKLSKIH